jgi:phosphomevalonate kinase
VTPSDPQRNTLRGSPVVAAPGKVFVMGEYAVLEGAPAVVASIGRYAVGQYVPGNEPESEFVAHAVREALAGIGDRAAALPEGSVMVDSRAFSADGRKLGLGSSAAVTAASVASVLELAGLPVASNRELCFSIAESAHRLAQGGLGSGADVAAAVHGGLLQYRRPAGGYPIAEQLRQPAALKIVLFAEGKPSATPALLRRVREFAESRPSAYAEVMHPLRETSEQFVEAFAEAKVGDLIATARAFQAALVELGTQSGISIVTTRFEIAADLAINLGGVAKPSGAGGGDVGVGLFDDDDAAKTFASRIEELGMRVLDTPIEAKGVHRRQPSANL